MNLYEEIKNTLQKDNENKKDKKDILYDNIYNKCKNCIHKDKGCIDCVD